MTQAPPTVQQEAARSSLPETDRGSSRGGSKERVSSIHFKVHLVEILIPPIKEVGDLIKQALVKYIRLSY